MIGPGEIDHLVIVIPAHNEEELLPRCLAAVGAAIEPVVATLDPAPPIVSVVIVLDRCTDGTETIAAGFPGVHLVRSDTGGVGAARRAGVRGVLKTPADFTGRTWIASTDADSAVPENWLASQLAFARNDVHLVLGTVEPDECLDGEMRARWAAEQWLVEGHPHVHGANLGVRADRYLAAGEFPGIDADEDIALVAALRRLRVCEIRTARIPVRTSGRLVGRTPGGFAGYLRAQTARLPVIMETGVLQVDDAGALP
ncbi:glycosyltransferase [Cryobacterium sp. MDB1-18-2]|uniref:4,4'-diaponeurosporenoate glycosyltransferase n=2 Tax=Cryobacterium TaxID=69578 RepID=A0ABY2IUQ1_9MICO|nr:MULTISPECIES: glycosyltransferase [Cryobacterium]TFC23195.1 glycosyltransferase [Cryobacterium sp. MDB1-18-2]TFC23631.1 glycosyltransferase [Cryobacterium glucosi]TFC40497.1 glycosyltransferase [Cryobacterium sp. MDB1-18-1]